MNRAILYLIFATSLYAVINVGVKSLNHLPASEIVVFRALVTLALCGFFISRKKISFWGSNRKILLYRGIFGTVALFSFFICVQNAPLAMSMTLINLSPIFTVIIAHFYLKEKANWWQWVFLLLSFVGVFMVKGGLEPVAWIWVLLGLNAAFFAALAYTNVRQLRTSEDPLVVIFYFPLVTLPIIGPISAWQWQTPEGWDWLILLSIGVLTQVAQYFMTLAYQLEAAAKVMIFNYAGIFWGVVLGWVVFKESLSWGQMTGVFIVFACLCGNFFVSQKARPSS